MPEEVPLKCAPYQKPYHQKQRAVPFPGLALSYSIYWCGEGDLFSRTALKTRKLYTTRTPQKAKITRNTPRSHTFSHTDANELGGRCA
jgi:hypothetical protein